MSGPADESRAGASRWRGPLAALAIFVLALATAYQGFWGADLREDVPAPTPRLQQGGELGSLGMADYRLTLWVIARNAWALLHRPLSIADGEPCHPVEHASALVHPGITPAVLGLPAELLWGDPVLTFNTALLAKTLVAALAMYLLVWDWSRSRVAGIAAGLLYAFHAQQLARPNQMHLTDNAWLLFGLFFARRLFAHGRLRDAIGLGAACALQMATAFYPFLAAAVAAVPMLLWLLWRYRLRALRPWVVSVVLGIVAAAGFAVFAPFLQQRAAGVVGMRLAHYAPWSDFAPGGEQFPGFAAIALVVCAFALGRTRALARSRGDPRFALLAAAVLVALFATGGNTVAQLQGAGQAPLALPNPFAALAAIVPGLDSVRGPERLAHGARQLLTVLAGLGVAALLRTVPARARAAAAATILAVVFLETLRPSSLGLAEEPPFAAIRLRPSEESLAFFETLAKRGNGGPLFEGPIVRGASYRVTTASRQQLRSAYHHRRTSGCYVAFVPESVLELRALSGRLPADDAIDEVRALGFTTLVVTEGGRVRPGARAEHAWAERIQRASERPDARLARIHEAGRRVAYELRARAR